MRRFLFVLCLILILVIGYLLCRSPQPLVSVVMPVYNRADSLPRAIESILNQTHQNFELIIVDDGSTDNSIAVAEGYAAKDSRIRLLKNEKNCGIACSRNRGTDAARGVYVAPMDSDDVALPIRLEKTVTFMETHPDVAVVDGVTIDIDHPVPPEALKNPKEYSVRRTADENKIGLMINCCVQNVTVLMRRSFLTENKIRYDENFVAAEDYHLWAQILLKGGQFVSLENPVTRYRYHKTNPDFYYSEMWLNVVEIRRMLLGRFFVPTAEDLQEKHTFPEICPIIQKLQKANAPKELLSPQTLDVYHDLACKK